MTKLRPPLSIDAALARIAGHLPGGYGEMAIRVGRSESTVRKWGDPECRECMPIDCGIVLDLAYRAAGGEGAPIFEAYGSKLQAEGLNWFADEIMLGHLAIETIKECSDAEAALVLASQPGSSPRERATALREAEEAIAVLMRVRMMLGGAAPAALSLVTS